MHKLKSTVQLRMGSFKKGVRIKFTQKKIGLFPCGSTLLISLDRSDLIGSNSVAVNVAFPITRTFRLLRVVISKSVLLKIRYKT